MNFKRSLVVFILSLGFAIPTFATSIALENRHLIDLNVVFQRVSHQNPWVVGEPFQKRAKAISLGKGRFLAVTLNQQKPVYAGFDSSDYSLEKLRIESYDPETGFLVLSTSEKDRIPASVSLEEGKEAKLCPKGKTRYIQFPFSKTFIKAILLEKKESEEPSFLILHNTLCGISIGESLVPTEYVRYFLQSTGIQARFPHPGMVLDIFPTPSERKYYFGENRNGILVSEVFPGVGPAYSLFPGDSILSVNGLNLSSVSDWDKRDRVLDLILRNPDGRLKAPGSPVQLNVYRNQRTISVTYKLSPYATDAFLIPEQAKNLKPLYWIMGGFFFTELTGSYLKEFGEEYRSKSDKKLVFLLDFFQSKSHPIRERIVILSRVFPVEGNAGYHEFQDLILQTVNGERITSLEQFKKKIAENNTNYIAMEFSGGKIAVFSRSDLKQIESEILSTYKISRLQNLEDE